jgi:hypothetical protein
MPGDLGRRMIVEFSHPLSMANSFLNRLEIRLKRTSTKKDWMNCAPNAPVGITVRRHSSILGQIQELMR